MTAQLVSRYLDYHTAALQIQLYENNENHKQQQKFLPKVVKKLYFGMPMEEFALKKKRLPTDKLEREAIRYRWLETFSQKSDIAAAVYYFDLDGNKPLYEIVLFYRNIPARTKFLEKTFGPPNYNEVEWKFPTGEGFILRAWNYEDRLVIVGAIEGTEWEIED